MTRHWCYWALLVILRKGTRGHSILDVERTLKILRFKTTHNINWQDHVQTCLTVLANAKKLMSELDSRKWWWYLIYARTTDKEESKETIEMSALLLPLPFRNVGRCRLENCNWLPLFFRSQLLLLLLQSEIANFSVRLMLHFYLGLKLNTCYKRMWYQVFRFIQDTFLFLEGDVINVMGLKSVLHYVRHSHMTKNRQKCHLQIVNPSSSSDKRKSSLL